MKDLTKKENWDEDLRYVARSRLIIGLVAGKIIGQNLAETKKEK